MELQVSQVAWSTEGKKIIDGVSLDTTPGEFIGLIGPNGSGKSTLLRTIYRVLKPIAGYITLAKDNVWHLPTKTVAQKMGVVTQERSSDFDFTVYDIVMMGRNPHKSLFDSTTAEDKEIVYTSLQRVNMIAFAHRQFQTLSGGEKQRVLIARALAQQAKLLILDEPTNHLDIRYQLEILELIKSLGVTALAALHDLNLSAAYCHRLYLLHHGRIIIQGTPEEVFTPAIIYQVYGIEAIIDRHPLTGHLSLAFAPSRS